MGMITRVRGRLRSFHTIPKLDPKLQDEKIAESVCLLSVVLLLPYCSKGHTPLLLGLGGMWLLPYSCLVLPLLISANYKYPVRWLRSFISQLPGMARRLSGPLYNFLLRIYAPLDKCEDAFMKMTNLSNMATQLIFFMMCDKVLLCNTSTADCANKRVTGLYSLMFYNVIAYCVSYIKELIEKEDWSPYVNMAQHSDIKHLAMSATKIVLEWTKAITFIITVTFMLLVFGLEQGLQNYQPTCLYTYLTWTYYMCTEKVFMELFPPILTFLRFNMFEALEALYAPVILRYYTITLSSILVLSLLFYGQFRFAGFAMYLTIFLRTKDTYLHYWRKLRNEQTVLGRFRQASPEELEAWDDVCAVCLSPMIRARVTPCHHLFHADCLRLCLNSSDLCPICKREYTFIT